jgi:alkanesulfonate monooxygenase SsuD/methylene tetrahydromethanopterin reductase-like flavin-dependent oxidoreductase (luciferase family)
VQWDYGFFDEPTDARQRAGMLDEGLSVLTGLWSGEMFKFQGDHYRLQEMRFLPKPAQTPRIPIWVSGWWPNKPPMRRAAHWDGAVPGRLGAPMTPDDMRDVLAYIRRNRVGSAPFDLVGGGATSGTDPARDAELVGQYAAVGVDWWIEDVRVLLHRRGVAERQQPPAKVLVRRHRISRWNYTASASRFQVLMRTRRCGTDSTTG